MSKKSFLGFISILLALGILLTCAIGSSWFTNGDIKTWFNSWGQNKPDDGENKGDVEEQDLHIELSSVSSGSLVSDSAVSASLFDEPIALASSGDVLTVSALVTYADGSAVPDYYQSVGFEGVGSDFDTYFNLSVSGNTATVTCKGAFAGTRELKCYSVIKPDVSNTVSMTYAQRPVSMSVNFGNYEGGQTTGLAFSNTVNSNALTLKLSDTLDIQNNDWQNERIKFLDG